jgi:hypothetical protein
VDAWLSWRRTEERDLPACLRLNPAKNGAEQVGDAAALSAWQTILKVSDAAKSAVVEMHSNWIVGFGLGLREEAVRRTRWKTRTRFSMRE